METRRFSFARGCYTKGTTNPGSVSIQALPPTSSIHCMETRLGQYNNRCVPAFLGLGVQFRFSSIQLDNSGSMEDLQRKYRSSNHSDFHMVNSTLLCTTSRIVFTATISSISNKKSVNTTAGKESSSSIN